MRGQVKPVNSLVISGNCYFENYHRKDKAEPGDILLSPQIENKNISTYEDTYHMNGLRGYLRAYIYIKQNWGILNQTEIFPDRENNFGKNDLIIDVANLCAEMVSKLAGAKIYRTYREHYTIHEYVPNAFKGKKGHYNNKKGDKNEN